MDNIGLKALIIGASGAVGRVLVRELVNSQQWSEITVIVRRSLEEWESLKGINKLKIIIIDSLDCLQQCENWEIFKNYNVLFSTLGPRLSDSKEQITLVDFTYPQYAAKIAKLNNIPHFSMISGNRINEGSKNSMFHMIKTKGLAEEALSKEQFPCLSINRPGAILNRVNYQIFGESIFKYMPFAPKIDCGDLAKALRMDAEKTYIKLRSQNQSPIIIINSNQDLINLAK